MQPVHQQHDQSQAPAAPARLPDAAAAAGHSQVVGLVLVGVVLAAHILFITTILAPDRESLQQAALATILPGSRSAFDPPYRDALLYWTFVVAGLLLGVAVPGYWLRQRRDSAPRESLATVPVIWLVVVSAMLLLSWGGAHIAPLVFADRAAAFQERIQLLVAAGGLAVSIAICIITPKRGLPQTLTQWLPSPKPSSTARAGAGKTTSGTGQNERRREVRGPIATSVSTAGGETAIGLWIALATAILGSAAAALLLWIPDPWRPVSDAFGWDRLFHWSYTVLGPSLGVLHGGTPGVDIVSHHGLGLPAAIAALARLGLDPTYANLIRVQMVGTIIWYGLLALLLRYLLGRRLWTGTAFVWALALQFSGGWAAGTFAWWHPQLGVLRNPLDVALLLAVALHHRSSRRRWVVLAVLLASASLWWVTDTGLMNLLIFTAYIAARQGLAPGTLLRRSTSAILAGVAVLAASLVGFLLLALATVGRAIVSPVFWEALSEGPRLYGQSGLYGRPVDPLGLTTAHLYLTPAFYVTVAAVLLSLAVAHRTRGAAPVLLAIVAWGLLLYQHFIRGSEPSYWFRHSTPLVVVASYLFAHGPAELAGRHRVQSNAANALPAGGTSRWAAAGLLGGGLLVLAIGFTGYPNMLWGQSSARADCWPTPRAALCVDTAQARPDLPQPTAFLEGVAAIQRLTATDEPAAVISPMDVLYLSLAERGPLWRHFPLDHQPPTQQSLDRTLQRLNRRAPSFVFFDRTFPLGSNTAMLNTDQLAAALDAAVRAGYELVGQAGYLEVWRRAT